MGKLVWSCDVRRKGVVKWDGGLYILEYANPPLKILGKGEKV